MALGVGILVATTNGWDDRRSTCSFFAARSRRLSRAFKDSAVDHASYGRLIEHQIASGVDGLIVAGTSGEPFALSVAERCALLETALKVVKKRVPVIAATGGFALADTLALTAHAESAGADAVMVLAPPFAKPPQRGLVDYFVTVARSTRLPFFLYQISSRTNATAASLETCRAVIKSAPNVIGMKQSDDDRVLVRNFARRGRAGLPRLHVASRRWHGT